MKEFLDCFLVLNVSDFKVPFLDHSYGSGYLMIKLNYFLKYLTHLSGKWRSIVRKRNYECHVSHDFLPGFRCYYDMHSILLRCKEYYFTLTQKRKNNVTDYQSFTMILITFSYILYTVQHLMHPVWYLWTIFSSIRFDNHIFSFPTLFSTAELFNASQNLHIMSPFLWPFYRIRLLASLVL